LPDFVLSIEARSGERPPHTDHEPVHDATFEWCIDLTLPVVSNDFFYGSFPRRYFQ